MNFQILRVAVNVLISQCLEVGMGLCSIFGFGHWANNSLLWNVTQGLVIDETVVSMVMNPIIPPVVENIWSTWALLNEKDVFHIVLIVCQSTVCEFNLYALVIRPIPDVNNSISVCTVSCCTCSTERAARQTFIPYSYHYVEWPWPLEWCTNTLVELLDTLGIPVVSILFCF
jgi:hypothetical protein